MSVPIFDSLAHPTLTGSWLNTREGLTFDQVFREMQQNNYIGCCAVGMPGQDGYTHKEFMDESSKYESMIPIAPFDFQVVDKSSEIDQIVDYGFQGIKIHPRLSGLCLQKDMDALINVCTLAAEKKMTVFFCTYCHQAWKKYPDYDPMRMFVRLLKAVPKVRMVMVHGGDVRVLEYMELVRFNDNVLLDLSLTLCKYSGSSIDLDLRYLFQNFDCRISIGTDSPEYSYAYVRERFENLAQGIDDRKVERLAHRNILQFLNKEI